LERQCQLCSIKSSRGFYLDANGAVQHELPGHANSLLNLNVGFGYDKYFQHDELSTWRVDSGSELSFDIYVKDFSINLHDRFQYTQDSASQSAVAGTAEYGSIENTAGLLVTWDLSDVTIGLGYDHLNVMSPAQRFEYLDRASEMFLGPGRTQGASAHYDGHRSDRLVDLLRSNGSE
jgi:predicted porin